MSVTMIQDLRWGDTGKGKISEYLSHPDRCDVSVRAVGGANAGHVIMKGTRKMSLHLLPAGCVHEGVDVVLGRGMVTHLPTLLKEIEDVRAMFGTDPGWRLHMANENHILFEGHKMADAALEERKGDGAVGTTKSGIGPAYADKMLRVGMRMEMLRKDLAIIKDAYQKLLRHWADMYGIQLTDDQKEKDVWGLLKTRELLGHCITDISSYWRKKISKRVIVEGAQGSLLSIDNSGYPYVTSSATTVNGQLQGAGIPHRELTKVIGTLKMYDTRVGNGPMRTEHSPELMAEIRERGGERGSTTGRNRRTGWLDLEDTEKRAWEEGADELAVLKGDVLDPYEEIVFYTGPGEVGTQIETMPGWSPHSIRSLRHWKQLPRQAQDIYRFIGDLTKVPVRYIGTGPESSELIVRDGA